MVVEWAQQSPAVEPPIIMAFTNVTFRFPEEVEPMLYNGSLTIRQKERVVITGASGSGKSTLL